MTPPRQRNSVESRSSQDVCRDPCFQQTPPRHQQQQMQPLPVEMNEMRPKIQQGVIQCPVRQGTQSNSIINTNQTQPTMMPPTGVPLNNPDHNDGNVWPDPEENGRGRLPGYDPMNSG